MKNSELNNLTLIKTRNHQGIMSTTILKAKFYHFIQNVARSL